MVPDALWTEAVSYANYIRNRVRTMSNKERKTPFETKHGRKPDIFHLRSFGCKAIVHIPKQNQDVKFTPRGEVRIFVGTDRGEAFRVFIDKPRKVIVSKEVTFDESSPNSDTTCNTQNQFISFGLPCLEAEYFGHDGSTDVVQNLEEFSNELQDGEDNHDY